MVTLLMGLTFELMLGLGYGGRGDVYTASGDPYSGSSRGRFVRSSSSVTGLRTMSVGAGVGY